MTRPFSRVAARCRTGPPCREVPSTRAKASLLRALADQQRSSTGSAGSSRSPGSGTHRPRGGRARCPGVGSRHRRRIGPPARRRSCQVRPRFPDRGHRRVRRGSRRSRVRTGPGVRGVTPAGGAARTEIERRPDRRRSAPAPEVVAVPAKRVEVPDRTVGGGECGYGNDEEPFAPNRRRLSRRRAHERSTSLPPTG